MFFRYTLRSVKPVLRLCARYDHKQPSVRINILESLDIKDDPYKVNSQLSQLSNTNQQFTIDDIRYVIKNKKYTYLDIIKTCDYSLRPVIAEHCRIEIKKIDEHIRKYDSQHVVLSSCFQTYLGLTTGSALAYNLVNHYFPYSFSTIPIILCTGFFFTKTLLYGLGTVTMSVEKEELLLHRKQLTLHADTVSLLTIDEETVQKMKHKRDVYFNLTLISGMASSIMYSMDTSQMIAMFGEKIPPCMWLMTTALAGRYLYAVMTDYAVFKNSNISAANFWLTCSIKKD